MAWQFPGSRLIFRHKNDATAIAVSPDGTILAAGNLKRIRLWMLPTKKELSALSQSRILSLAFSPQGDFLASGSVDDTRVWETATWKLVGTIPVKEVWSIDFTPDGRTLGLATEKSASFHEIPTGKNLGQIDIPNEGCLAISPDGKLAAVGGKTFFLYNLATKVCVREIGKELFHDEIPGIDCMAFSPDGKMVASSHYDGIRFWEVASGALVFKLQSTFEQICGMAFSSDGKRLFAGGGTFGKSVSPVLIWDLDR